MSIRTFGVVAALTILASCGTFAQAYPAEPQKPSSQITVDKAEAVKTFASFDTGLNALSKRFQATLIAEDTAFAPELGDDKARSLVAEMNAGKQDIATVVRTFAAYYDFDAVRYRNHCYLLTKRFTADNDMACVTLAEWQDAINGVTRIVESVISKETGSDHLSALRQLSASLTEEQVAALSTENGLSVARMTDAQKAIFHQIGMHFYLGTRLDRADDRQEEVALTLKEETRFGWFDYELGKKSGERVFGYAAPVKEGVAQREIYPVTPQRFVRPSSHNHFMIEGAFVEGKAVDTTVPDEKTEPRTDTTVTLGQVVEEANRKLDAAAGTFEVAPMLAAKRVTVSGKQYAAPDILMGGIAELYGLRVRFDSALNHSTIERFRPRVDNKLENVRYALLAVLPVPFLRAMHVTPDGTDLVAMRDDFGMNIGKRRTLGVHSRSDQAWRNAAIKELRTILEPILKKNKVSDLPGKELPVNAQFALVNRFMSYGAEPLRALVVTPVPVYMTDLSKTFLKGGLNKRQDGTDWFYLNVYGLYDDGGLSPFFSLNSRITPLNVAK